MSVAAETGVKDPGHLMAGEYAGGSDVLETRLPLAVHGTMQFETGDTVESNN
jgi:hypothetical protein